jgi:hypothetical protein
VLLGDDVLERVRADLDRDVELLVVERELAVDDPLHSGLVRLQLALAHGELPFELPDPVGVAAFRWGVEVAPAG